MPYHDPDVTDPMELVAVELGATPEAVAEMARAFVEEFARSGYETEALLAVFRNPAYLGAHGAYRALGEEALREIIEECICRFGSFRIHDRGR